MNEITTITNEDDGFLPNAIVLWNLNGEVAVVDHPDRDNRSMEFDASLGAGNHGWRDMSDFQRLECLLLAFQQSEVKVDSFLRAAERYNPKAASLY